MDVGIQLKKIALKDSYEWGGEGIQSRNKKGIGLGDPQVSAHQSLGPTPVTFLDWMSPPQPSHPWLSFTTNF